MANGAKNYVCHIGILYFSENAKNVKNRPNLKKAENVCDYFAAR
jgi:hypothetical protein